MGVELHGLGDRNENIGVEKGRHSHVGLAGCKGSVGR